jgi:dienelactone hydrolase
MRMLTSIVAALLITSGIAHAELVKKTIEYKQGDATLKGYLVYDNAKTEKRPGIVVVPEWWGVNDYAKHRADMLAELGYVALAADIYGNGEVTTDMKRAGELATKFKADRELLRARVKAALDTLKEQPQVDQSKLAAIGYCFGGTAVLELARSGADVNGVVSFHGALDTPMPAKKGEIKPKILVLTGADDPMVPPEQVKAFEKEMSDAGADAKVVAYPGAVHSFTNPDSSKLGVKGMGYNKEADEKSWQAMKDFFEQIFK